MLDDESALFHTCSHTATSLVTAVFSRFVPHRKLTAATPRSSVWAAAAAAHPSSGALSLSIELTYGTSSIIDGNWKMEWVACGYRSQVGAHRSEAVSWGEKQSAIAADALRSGNARARSRRRWGSARNGMASLRRETRNRMASLRSEKLRWRTCAESCGLGSWREIVDPCWRAWRLLASLLASLQARGRWRRLPATRRTIGEG